jgi:hypothetical protein
VLRGDRGLTRCSSDKTGGNGEERGLQGAAVTERRGHKGSKGTHKCSCMPDLTDVNMKLEQVSSNQRRRMLRGGRGLDRCSCRPNRKYVSVGPKEVSGKRRCGRVEGRGGGGICKVQLQTRLKQCQYGVVPSVGMSYARGGGGGV